MKMLRAATNEAIVQGIVLMYDGDDELVYAGPIKGSPDSARLPEDAKVVMNPADHAKLMAIHRRMAQ